MDVASRSPVANAPASRYPLPALKTAVASDKTSEIAGIAAARLLTLCGDHSEAGLRQLVLFVESQPEPNIVLRELRPLAEHAAGAALLWSVLCFLSAAATALVYFKHLPISALVCAGSVATLLLWKASRAAARQGLMDSAQHALARLADTGPMSRETVQDLCKDVLPLPAFATAEHSAPLFQAHLSLARFLAQQQRRSSR